MNTAFLPEAFLNEMKELLGDEYKDYLASFEQQPRSGLRANGLKISGSRLTQLLPWNLTPVPWAEGSYYYDSSELRPALHPAYSAGLFYLQEPSAMAPADFLPIEPGDRVLDLCAAPGGKSTALAAKLRGTGLLVSNDISYSRARALLKNLELAGAANVCVVSESPEKLSGPWTEFFDKILVDAPCSGEGMFRREEEMVRDWEKRGPAYYAPLQREILVQAVRMLRPGGQLLYSTCTFSRLEDEGNVEFLLQTCPELELVPLDADRAPGAVSGIHLPGVLRFFPHRVKGEGHFLALLKKKGGALIRPAGELGPDSRKGGALEREELESREPKGGGMSFRRKKNGERLGELGEFLGRCVLAWEPEQVFISGENVYLLPQGLATGLPFRFLRTGLLLGQLKKGRFEPSQALAMALGRDGFSDCRNLDLEDERVLRYLKGETIPLKPEESAAKGWQLVQCGGYSLGWAKGAGASLKNKYYPGWRWQ